MAALAGLPQPIGLFPTFIAQRSETIVLKEKVMSLTGDSFSIKLADGTPLFQVEGKLMTITGRKRVTDMQGNHMFDIVKELLHLHHVWALEDASGKKIMEVKNKFQLIGSTAVATFTSTTTGKQEQLMMKGKWFDTTAEITDGTQGSAVVARMDRKLLSGKDIFFGQQTYGVVVAPGMDMALVAAMCICLDDRNEG